MRIIRNYLLRELIGPFLLALLISTMVLAASHIVQVADLIINKGVNAFYVVTLFFLLTPWLLTFTIPISTLSATLLAFGRLASDNEILALKANGVGLIRIASPILVVGIILSLLCIPLNDRILPKSGYNARKLIKEIAIKNPLAILEPGVFIKAFKNYIIFVYNIEKNKLKNIRIYQPRQGEPTRTIVAEEGEIITSPDKNAIKLKLKHGSADESLPQDPENFYKLVFETYYMKLDLKDAIDYDKIQRKPREMSIKELRSEIEKLKKDNISTIPLHIEIHNKLALAFSNLVFILIGVPIAVSTHRREKSINFGLTMILFIAYWGIMLGGVACVIRNIVPPWAGIWMANIILFSVGVFLFAKLGKR